MPWFTFKFQDFALSFLSVVLEGVPFLLLGSLISGLVDVFVSSERLEKMLPKNPTGAILLSGLLGLIFPMCECGSVIVIRRFIRKGLPVACAITYMLGAPILSPIVALSTFAAFRGQNAWEMTSLRMAFGYLIAVGIGFIVHRLRASEVLHPQLLNDLPNKRSALRFAAAPTAPPGARDERDFGDVTAGVPLGRKLRMAVQSATADFLDVAFFFIIGTAIASVLNTAVHRSVIDSVATNPPIAIAALMVLAAALALCSTNDAFVAANMFPSFPFVAKLAFLVFGPMFDVKLFWLYGLIFRRKFVICLSIGLFAIVWLICWTIFPLTKLPGW